MLMVEVNNKQLGHILAFVSFDFRKNIVLKYSSRPSLKKAPVNERMSQIINCQVNFLVCFLMALILLSADTVMINFRM